MFIEKYFTQLELSSHRRAIVIDNESSTVG